MHRGDCLVYLKLDITSAPRICLSVPLAEWQKALPADYEADKVNELDAQLKVFEAASRAEEIKSRPRRSRSNFRHDFLQKVQSGRHPVWLPAFAKN